MIQFFERKVAYYYEQSPDRCFDERLFAIEKAIAYIELLDKIKDKYETSK